MFSKEYLVLAKYEKILMISLHPSKEVVGLHSVLFVYLKFHLLFQFLVKNFVSSIFTDIKKVMQEKLSNSCVHLPRENCTISQNKHYNIYIFIYTKIFYISTLHAIRVLMLETI